ncbi:MAG TPA: metal ABC transporter substrate-binding protein [Candidatus Paceibacterota bacterium]|nr:metal ABC transporter substrate-binding protein [Verrucomicrobiota bacterium]HRY48049.1 metal ABC transporter substrate-binding protein [Candidatus Paceibacterota bacterium]
MAVILGGWIYYGLYGAIAWGADGNSIRVLTSFFPVYCLAVEVAGDGASVENLLPAKVGPHDYQLAPKDLRKITLANLVIMNGLGLESWLERVIQQQTPKERPQMVRLADGLDDELIREGASGHSHGDKDSSDGHGHEHSDINPHIWLDPCLAAHGVTNIMEAMIKSDPSRSEGYRKRAEVLIGRLEALHREYERRLAPVRAQAFITHHQAFPYLIRRYGLKLAGVLEEVPEVEPSARHLKRLSQTIREQKVRVLFVEPQSTSKIAGQLARDHGIGLAELDPLEVGPLEAGAYERLMRQNLSILVNQLR